MRVASRRAKVAALYLRGVTNQFEIAERLGMDPDSGQSTVSRDLAAIRKGWRESALGDFLEMKSQVQAELELVKAEAWAAFERSKVEHISTRTSAGKRGDASTAMAEERKEKRDGDPRWLVVIADCEKQLRALGGLDNPIRVKIGGDENSPPIRHTHEHRISLAEFDALPVEGRLRVLQEQIRTAVRN